MSMRDLPIYLRWQNSVPLSEAHGRFGSRKLQRQINRSPHPIAGVIAAIAQSIGSLANVENSDTGDQARIHTEALKQAADAIFLIRSQILKKLLSGEYEAFGFRVGGDIDAPPIEISPRFFRSDWFRWEMDEIRSNDYAFDRVKIDGGRESDVGNRPRMSGGQLALPAAVERVEDIPRNRRGPQSALGEIRIVYHDLRNSGALADCKTIKSISKKIAPVLERDKVRFPNGRGLAYSSFARHIKKIIEESDA